MKSYFPVQGLCEEIVTDNGPQFVAEGLELYLKEHGITHRRVTLYWPQANYKVEQFIIAHSRRQFVLQILKVKTGKTRSTSFYLTPVQPLIALRANHPLFFFSAERYCTHQALVIEPPQTRQLHTHLLLTSPR